MILKILKYVIKNKFPLIAFKKAVSKSKLTDFWNVFKVNFIHTSIQSKLTSIFIYTKFKGFSFFNKDMTF